MHIAYRVENTQKISSVYLRMSLLSPGPYKRSESSIDVTSLKGILWWRF